MYQRIRPYHPGSDRGWLEGWYSHFGLQCPAPDMLPDTTYVLLEDEKPVLVCGLILTNAQGLAFLEGLIKSPSVVNSKGHMIAMNDFLRSSCRKLGVRVMMTYCEEGALPRLYQRLGFNRLPTEWVGLTISTSKDKEKKNG